MQRLLRGERDRVKQEIEPAPVLLDALEHLFGLTFGAHVQRHENGRLKLLRERFNMLPCPIVQIGDCQLRAQPSERLSTAPCDRLIIGYSNNESLSSFQR